MFGVRLLFVVCCMLCVVCGLLFVVCCVVCVVCCLLYFLRVLFGVCFAFELCYVLCVFYV